MSAEDPQRCLESGMALGLVPICLYWGSGGIGTVLRTIEAQCSTTSLVTYVHVGAPWTTASEIFAMPFVGVTATRTLGPAGFNRVVSLLRKSAQGVSQRGKFRGGLGTMQTCQDHAT